MASRSSKASDTRLQLEYEIHRDESPTAAVARALGTATDAAPDELPPLYESIEPDAFDRLCLDAPDALRVEFEHHGFLVTVTGDGVIYLHPSDERAD